MGGDCGPRKSPIVSEKKLQPVELYRSTSDNGANNFDLILTGSENDDDANDKTIINCRSNKPSIPFYSPSTSLTRRTAAAMATTCRCVFNALGTR